MSKTPQMSRGQRAAQIWSLLSFAAGNRQVLSYGVVAKLIGAPTAALGGFLDPVDAWCMENQLPRLTAIVVSDESGVPGPGFAAENLPAAQMEVFRHTWTRTKPPSPADLEAAHEERERTRAAADARIENLRATVLSTLRDFTDADQERFLSLVDELEGASDGVAWKVLRELMVGAADQDRAADFLVIG